MDTRADLTIGRYRIKTKRALDTAGFGLSPREIEILIAMIEGQSVKDAALSFSVSPHTVDVFKRRIFKKLGVHNAASAAALGMAALLGAGMTPVAQPQSADQPSAAASSD